MPTAAHVHRLALTFACLRGAFWFFCRGRTTTRATYICFGPTCARMPRRSSGRGRPRARTEAATAETRRLPWVRARGVPMVWFCADQAVCIGTSYAFSKLKRTPNNAFQGSRIRQFQFHPSPPGQKYTQRDFDFDLGSSCFVYCGRPNL